MPLHCRDTGFSVLYDMTGSVGHGIFRTRSATSNRAANPPRPMTPRPLFPPSIRYPSSRWKFGKTNGYCHPNPGSYAQSPFAERRFSRRSLTKSITHRILTESLPHLPRLPITTPNARVDVPIPPRFAYVPRSGATGSTRSPSHSETPPPPFEIGRATPTSASLDHRVQTIECSYPTKSRSRESGATRLNCGRVHANRLTAITSALRDGLNTCRPAYLASRGCHRP